ncbi:regulator of G-protein signaling 1-like [Lissotriton helveticus]
MPGIFYTHLSSTVEPKGQEGTEEVTERKKPRTFMDLKGYLRSMFPPLEPGVKPSYSKAQKFHEDEAAPWSKSLECLLCYNAGRAAFHVFLKSEYSDENLDFWLACEHFKKSACTDNLQSQAQRIYQEYIKADAPRQVNLDFHTRESVAQKVREATLTCFDEAQWTVYMLMERDSYPRFLKSEGYLNLISRHQGCNGRDA